MPNDHEALAASTAVIAALATVALAVLTVSMLTRGPTELPPCSEWTNGCTICTRNEQGFTCSTPGIACVPHFPRCLGKRR